MPLHNCQLQAELVLLLHMNSAIPSREFTVDYPIADIKAAILTTSGTHNNPQLRYSPGDSNEILGVYKYTVLTGNAASGFGNGTVWLSIHDKGEKTKITITGIVSGSATLGNEKLAEVQDYILKLISQELKGTYTPILELKKNKGFVRTIVVIITGILIIAVSLLVFSV